MNTRCNTLQHLAIHYYTTLQQQAAKAHLGIARSRHCSKKGRGHPIKNPATHGNTLQHHTATTHLGILCSKHCKKRDRWHPIEIAATHCNTLQKTERPHRNITPQQRTLGFPAADTAAREAGGIPWKTPGFANVMVTSDPSSPGCQEKYGTFQRMSLVAGLIFCFPLVGTHDTCAWLA